MDTEGDGAPILVESTAELLTHQLSNHDTVKVPLSIITGTLEYRNSIGKKF